MAALNGRVSFPLEAAGVLVRAFFSCSLASVSGFAASVHLLQAGVGLDGLVVSSQL